MSSTTRLFVLFFAVVYIPGALRSETPAARKAIYDEKVDARVEIAIEKTSQRTGKEGLAVVKKSLAAYAEKILGARR